MRDDWSEDEENVLCAHYEQLGPAGIDRAGLLPKRTRRAMIHKARKLGLDACDLRIGGVAASEDFTGIPVHDYTEIDRVWMQTRVPAERGTGQLRARL